MGSKHLIKIKNYNESVIIFINANTDKSKILTATKKKQEFINGII
jgi:hypothetical protein